jgi:hypothetical protein
LRLTVSRLKNLCSFGTLVYRNIKIKIQCL